MITADNQRLYYGGAKDKNILVWDDNEELLQIIRVSIAIQEITLYPDREAFIEYLSSLSLEEEENKYALEMTRKAFHNRYSNKTPMDGKWEKKE